MVIFGMPIEMRKCVCVCVRVSKYSGCVWAFKTLFCLKLDFLLYTRRGPYVWVDLLSAYFDSAWCLQINEQIEMVLHELANALIFQGEIKEFVEKPVPVTFTSKNYLQVCSLCS